MAVVGSSEITERIKGLTECAICREQFRDPRSLPCTHAFCLKCLEGIDGASKKPGEKIPCPVCRGDFHMPENGAVGLPKHYIIQDLIGLKNALCNDCEACSDDYTDMSSEKTAVSFCVECKQRLCEMCTASHRRLTATRTHHLSKIGEGHCEKAGDEYPAKPCEKHPNRVLEIYCATCMTVICSTCLLDFHREHSFGCVKKALNDVRTQAKGDAESLAELVNRLKIAAEKRKLSMVEFKGEADKTQLEINQQAEWIKQQIEQDKQKLLKEVELIVKDRIKQNECEVKDSEELISRVERLAKLARELASEVKTTPCQVLKRACEIRDETVKMQQKYDGSRRVFDDSCTPDEYIRFTAATWPPLRGGNMVGKLVRTSAGGPRRPSLKRVISIDDPEAAAILGVTSLRDELFVIRLSQRNQPRHKIDVYSTTTFQLTRFLPVDDLDGDTIKIASCSKYNCLYLSSYGLGLVYRVNAEDGASIKWEVCSNPDGLSVNKEFHVVVSCKCANRLQVFTHEGELVAQVYLHSTEVNDIYHAAQMANGHYVISYGKPEDNIGVVDQQGHLVRTYRDDTSVNALRLLNPRYLVIDSRDNIISADWGNKRLILLNSSLTSARDLRNSLDPDGVMEDPYCLHLDESRDRLYVGEYDGKRILVFDDVTVGVNL